MHVTPNASLVIAGQPVLQSWIVAILTAISKCSVCNAADRIENPAVQRGREGFNWVEGILSGRLRSVALNICTGF